MDNIEYPLNFGACPNCGSDRLMANEMIRELKCEGKARLDIKACLFRYTSIIGDSTMKTVSTPVIVTSYDACVDCGTVFVVSARRGIATSGLDPANFNGN